MVGHEDAAVLLADLDLVCAMSRQVGRDDGRTFNVTDVQHQRAARLVIRSGGQIEIGSVGVPL